MAAFDRETQRRMRCLRVVLIMIILAGCGDESQLAPFTSDGCSLFPNRSLIDERDWCPCCFEHVLAYWKGGTEEEREIADLELKKCVQNKTGDEVLANVMYQGVRFGGSPYFYNWYRWGYGWTYDRKYAALTDSELKQAATLIKQYKVHPAESVCSSD